MLMRAEILRNGQFQRGARFLAALGVILAVTGEHNRAVKALVAQERNHEMTRDKLRELQRTVRGFANHRRIEILMLLGSNPSVDLTQIANRIGIQFKTCHEHSRRLAEAGLVSKQPKGRRVEHSITPLGRRVLSFLKQIA